MTAQAPGCIVYCGVCDYDYIWNRPQQLAQGLARSRNVLYLDLVPDNALRSVWRRRTGRNANLERRPRSRMISSSLTVLSPPPLLPGGTRFEAICDADSRLLARLIRRTLRSLGWSCEWLWISFPWRAGLPGQLGERFVAYDCMDWYSQLVPPAKRELVDRLERRILRGADVTFACTPALVERCEGISQNVHLVANGADVELFDAGTAPLPELSHLARPILGFLGTISTWFHIEMIEALARRRPDWTLVLAGPEDIDISVLRSLPNVHVTGIVPRKQLAAVVATFDVSLIPFRDCEFSSVVDPVKFYEYLAMGKPVVASGLPLLRSYPELCECVDSDVGMEAAIERTLFPTGDLERNRELVARRIAHARNNTWDRRTAAIESELAKIEQAARE